MKHHCLIPVAGLVALLVVSGCAPVQYPSPSPAPPRQAPPVEKSPDVNERPRAGNEPRTRTEPRAPREDPPRDPVPTPPGAKYEPRTGPVPELTLSVISRKNEIKLQDSPTGPWKAGGFVWLRAAMLGSGKLKAAHLTPYDWAKADQAWIDDMRNAIAKGVRERGMPADYDGYLQIDFEHWMPRAEFRGPIHFKATNPIAGREAEFNRGGELAYRTMFEGVKQACPRARVGFYQFPYTRAHAIPDGHDHLRFVYEMQDFSTINVYYGQIYPAISEEKILERVRDRMRRLLKEAPRDKPAVIQQWFVGVADAKGELIPLENIRAMLQAVKDIDDPRVVMVTMSSGDGLLDSFGTPRIEQYISEVLIPAARQIFGDDLRAR